jgi:hypothetical protein
MNAFAKLANVLVVPFALLNAFGGIVSGIWLAVLGEWGSIGYGIGILFGGGFGLGLAMMPGMLLAAPAVILLQKGNKIWGYVFGFLSQLYTIAVLTVWCIAVLYFFLTRINDQSTIPILLWSYGIAIGPIAWLAEKELQSGNEYAMLSTFFAQIAYLLVILEVLFTRVSLLDVLVLFGVVMFIGFCIQSRIAFALDKERDALKLRADSQ